MVIRTCVGPDTIITREDRVTANPSRLEAADVLVAIEIISPALAPPAG